MENLIISRRGPRSRRSKPFFESSREPGKPRTCETCPRPPEGRENIIARAAGRPVTAVPATVGCERLSNQTKNERRPQKTMSAAA
jgi:hypothetical protein